MPSKKSSNDTTQSTLEELGEIQSNIHDLLFYGVGDYGERIEGVSAIIGNLVVHAQDGYLDGESIAAIADGGAKTLELCSKHIRKDELKLKAIEDRIKGIIGRQRTFLELKAA